MENPWGARGNQPCDRMERAQPQPDTPSSPRSRLAKGRARHDGTAKCVDARPVACGWVTTPLKTRRTVWPRGGCLSRNKRQYANSFPVAGACRYLMPPETSPAEPAPRKTAGGLPVSRLEGCEPCQPTATFTAAAGCSTVGKISVQRPLSWLQKSVYSGPR